MPREETISIFVVTQVSGMVDVQLTDGVLLKSHLRQFNVTSPVLLVLNDKYQSQESVKAFSAVTMQHLADELAAQAKQNSDAVSEDLGIHRRPDPTEPVQ